MTNTYCRELSAVTNNVNDMRKAIDESKSHQRMVSMLAGGSSRQSGGQRPIIIVDELHRWTKAQQDFLLPYIERGDFTLIAATTENPSFRLNAALLSRCRVFVLQKLKPEEMLPILKRALKIKLERVFPEYMVDTSTENSDIRRSINSKASVYSMADLDVVKGETKSNGGNEGKGGPGGTKGPAPTSNETQQQNQQHLSSAAAPPPPTLTSSSPSSSPASPAAPSPIAVPDRVLLHLCK
ncbi:hypothetical protein HK102_001352, partial [Quaeritorhiza haematococci]